MHWEVEQKFRVPELPGVRTQLLMLGMQIDPAIHQVDHYFRHPSRDFAETDEALRLRQIGDQNFITYKGPKIDAVTKTRRELELPLPSGAPVHEQFVELLLALGFSAGGVVRKRREPGTLIFDSHEVDVALDEVEGLGAFVELEIEATDETLLVAKAVIAALQNRLGLTGAERRSYLELLQVQSLK